MSHNWLTANSTHPVFVKLCQTVQWSPGQAGNSLMEVNMAFFQKEICRRVTFHFICLQSHDARWPLVAQLDSGSSGVNNENTSLRTWTASHGRVFKFYFSSLVFWRAVSVEECHHRHCVQKLFADLRLIISMFVHLFILMTSDVSLALTTLQWIDGDEETLKSLWRF